MSDNSSNNKRIAKNTTFLYVRMFFVLVVTLYTSRVILNTLGVEDFGIYNVVSGFVSLFGFLNATLTASMQRFYNFELGKRGDDGLQLVYSTGLKIHFIIAIVLLVILESIGIWYINNIMVIPDGRLLAANVVYQSVVLSMILIVMQIPYLGAIMAYERMDYFAIISIVDVILKLAIVLVLPIIPFDKLIVYAILLSLISAFNFACYFIYSKNKFKSIKRSTTDKQLSREILAFSGWNLVGTFAFMIKDQGLNMLLNGFFGPVVNAARGVAFQVKSALGNFSQSISTAFRPQIVEAYAKDDFARVNNLFFIESKICFYLVLFLLLPLTFSIDFILNAWLGDIVPSQTNIFTILVLVDSLVCAFNPAIGHVANATGNIKKYQIANSIVNILIIPTAWGVVYITGHATSVFVVAIVYSIINQIVCMIELHRIYQYDILYFVKCVLFPCIFVAVLSIIPQLLMKQYVYSNGYQFLYSTLIDFIWTLGVIYVLGLNTRERSIIKEITKKIKRKIICQK